MESKNLHNWVKKNMYKKSFEINQLRWAVEGGQDPGTSATMIEAIRESLPLITEIDALPDTPIEDLPGEKETLLFLHEKLDEIKKAIPYYNEHKQYQRNKEQPTNNVYYEKELQNNVFGGGSLDGVIDPVRLKYDNKAFLLTMVKGIEQPCWKMTYLLNTLGFETHWSNGCRKGAKGVWFYDMNKENTYFIDIINGKIYPQIHCTFMGVGPQLAQAQLNTDPNQKPIDPKSIKLNQNIIDLGLVNDIALFLDSDVTTELLEAAQNETRIIDDGLTPSTSRLVP